MGKTKIEWTATYTKDGTVIPGYSFNPWWGCVKVSPGCKNCYAETLANRFGKNVWGVNGDRRFFGDNHWNEPLKWNRKAEKLGVRHKVFCGSMCDVFEDREDLVEPRNRLFDLIFRTPHLDWLLLTKRPENIERMFDDYDKLNKHIFQLHNIWVGTSVENQEQADIRIPHLLKIPARVRFLSVEPLLEAVDIKFDTFVPTGKGTKTWEWLSWIIVGFESGPKKRPFNLDWARSIRDQCQEARVPFFMKQVDKVQPIPEDLMIREFPK